MILAMRTQGFFREPPKVPGPTGRHPFRLHSDSVLGCRTKAEPGSTLNTPVLQILWFIGSTPLSCVIHTVLVLSPHRRPLCLFFNLAIFLLRILYRNLKRSLIRFCGFLLRFRLLFFPFPFTSNTDGVTVGSWPLLHHPVDYVD